MLIRSFIFFSMVLLISCQKEANNIPETGTKKFTFTIANKYVDSATLKWVFITDKNGISSDAYPLTDNSSVIVDVPDSYVDGDKFMLNLLSYHSYIQNIEVHSFYMESYTDIIPGDYKLKKDSVLTSPPTSSTHFMKMSNVPISSPSLSLGSFGKSVTGSTTSYYPGNLWDMKTFFTDNTTAITYYGFFNNEWKYLTINGVTNNQTSEVAYSTMKPMENHVEFKFDNSYVARCGTYGVNNKDYLRRTALNFSSSTNTTPVKSLTYYYPNTSFNEYITEVSLTTNTMSQKEYTLRSNVAGNFTGWSGRVLSSTILNGSLNVELSQDADILSCYSSTFSLSNGKQYNFNWLLNTSGEKSKSIKLPVLPSQITAQYPQWSTHIPRFASITAVKTNVADAYNDYISNKFIKDVNPVLPYFFYPNHQRVVTHLQIVP